MKFIWILLLLSGCASEATFHTCRVVDTVTTIEILHHGGTELNPILAGVIHGVGYAGLIGIELGIMYGVHRWWKHASDGQHVLVNAVSCTPAIFNLRTI